MTISKQPTDNVIPIESIAPNNYGVQTLTSGWVDTSNFHQFMAVFQSGSMSSGSTFDFKVEQATDNSGTGAKDLTGASVPQYTEAGGDGGKQSIINFKASLINDGYTHIRVSATVAVAAGKLAVELYGYNPRYGSAEDYGDSIIREIIDL